MYLIHWPVQYQPGDGKYAPLRLPLHEQWPRMEACQKSGRARRIGVSNFNFQLLNDLLAYAEIRPAVNQMELNPYLSQFHFVEWLKQENILPVAYCPVGGRGAQSRAEQGNFMKEPLVLQLAEKHGCTPAQVGLSWGLARGHAVVPKSTNEARQRENLAAIGVVLTGGEVEQLNQLNRNLRTYPAFDMKGFCNLPVFE